MILIIKAMAHGNSIFNTSITDAKGKLIRSPIKLIIE